jgi:hypothetical protein
MRATAYHYLGDVHLRLLRAPALASRYLGLSLKLDACGAEAGEGRQKLVHATAARIKEEAKQTRGGRRRRSKTKGRIDRESEEEDAEDEDTEEAFETPLEQQRRHLRTWQGLITRFEQDLHGLGPHNSDVPSSKHVLPLAQRCKESAGEVRWQKGSPVPAAEEATPSLVPSRPQASASTLLRWALYQAYDHMQAHSQAAAAGAVALKGAAQSEKENERHAQAAKQQRAVAWGYLQQAHEDEMWLRYRYNAHSADATTVWRPETNRSLEGPPQTEYRQRYSLLQAVQATASLKKTFGADYWPPPAVHASQVGYAPSTKKVEDSEEGGRPWAQPIFIVGFFRTGSSLLERMLTAHSGVDSLGEDSVLGVELLAL